MVNARKVENELNVFNGLFASHVFWVVWVIIVGFQVRRGSQPCTAVTLRLACATTVLRSVACRPHA